MGTPYMSEIRLFSFGFAPKGWALCNGQVLAIAQNQALFALLGTTYGGNGVQTFALPNLQAKVPLHFGNGYALGQTGGEVNHTLALAELPQHSHGLQAATGGDANASNDPAGRFPAGQTSAKVFAPTPNPAVGLNIAAVPLAGNSQPHSNMQPSLVLNYCIALVGIFPPRN